MIPPTSPTDRKKLTGEITLPKESLDALTAGPFASSDVGALFEKAGGDLTLLTEALFSSAISLEASDVHLEPEELRLKIRYRLDGLLQDVALLDRAKYEKLVSRLKLSAGIKLNIHDRPQDGRFSVRVGSDALFEVRVSTLPSEYGETIVMRILNPRHLLSLDDLALEDGTRSLFRKELKKSTGMIVVTGPTGSGKTTTLYAFVQEAFNPELKIVTIEDPIEYHIDGVSQTQTHPEKGYDFASGLRAIVRQDPDVILVGEIRDGETAHIALQAALTGHLVFSTLHTNDAAGTIARFQSLGAEINTIAAALNIIIAQRLVRRVCPRCSTQRPATKEERALIESALSSLRKDASCKIPDPLVIPKAGRCAFCNMTGYKGRAGLYETLEVTDEMERFLLTNPSTSALKAKAIKEGMITMFQDGICKVVKQITTLEEVDRVTEE
ncbi:MAG: type II/IV secretion system protein [Candidatus Wildermuthbacteria bacterium]|nr:type II/IV secretion system protein [Candidatus Wildermuthbacteria bacterium]